MPPFQQSIHSSSANLLFFRSRAISRKAHLKRLSPNHDYLRIRWEALPDDWRLSRVQGFYTKDVRNVVRNWTILDSHGEDPQDCGRIFYLDGAPQVDRIRVVTPQANTLLSATIYYWSISQNRWLQLTSGSHHHIGRGDNVVKSSAVKMNKNRVGQFKVVNSKGHLNTPMQLEIGWRTDSLIFLAQGNPPFTLVAGRTADAQANFPQERMYDDRSIIRLSKGGGPTAVVTLGERFSLAGGSVTQVERYLPWRQMLLWFASGCCIRRFDGD